MVSADIKLEKFEGPLQLLLQLIEQEDLNITEVAISEVTDQYLKYLDKLEEDQPEELADFLVIATRLVYLKSKNLLPYLNPEEEEGPSLADQLKLYKQYLEASREVGRLWDAGNIAYGRLEPPVKAEGFTAPAGVESKDLQTTMTMLLARLRPINPLPKICLGRAVSVKQRLEAINDLLKQHRQISFRQLLSGAGSRTEVIVNFLALLELVKQQIIFIKQPNSFEEMVIIKN